ncbi:MAG: hypothetical protein N4A35_02750 [Flavobacteriales bacterium]|jgi:hypothetical protein|nr:hypothetical protein [Flavobacteriales bacterium]
MKKRLVISIVVLLLITLGVFSTNLLSSSDKISTSEKAAPVAIKKQKNEEQVSLEKAVVHKAESRPFPSSIAYSWDDLKIEPLKILEGGYYVFTAFEVDPFHDELILAGSYDKNLVKYITEDTIISLEIHDTPLDIIVDRDYLYVLCLSKFYVIKDKRIVNEFNHNIANVTLYDKLINFDNSINVLMADGSSYQLTKDKKGFQHSKSLLTMDNEELWVQKTSAYSFEIRTQPQNDSINVQAKYNHEIGSIMLFGENSQDYFCIVDVITYSPSITATRQLMSSKNQFTSKIIELPNNTYTYVKNDLKIHDDLIAYLVINDKGLTIKTMHYE